jgi:ribonuclease D
LVELLQAVLKARAAAEGIAPSLLATTADIQALVESKRQAGPADLPLLRGWRRQLVGELLLQVLQGTVLVSVDAKSGVLQIEAQTRPQSTL